MITWVIFGLIIGLVAHFLDPHPTEGGWVGAVVLGVTGALVGGFLGHLLLGTGMGGFNFTSLSIAILGSLFLLIVSRIIMRAD